MAEQRTTETDAPMDDQIGWDEHGNLYLPERWAHIGVAMDRRDAADEMQRAFDGARRARATLCGASGVRCGDDLGVTCGECREMRLGVRG